MFVILQDFYPLVNSKLVKTCNKNCTIYQEQNSAVFIIYNLAKLRSKIHMTQFHDIPISSSNFDFKIII